MERCGIVRMTRRHCWKKRAWAAALARERVAEPVLALDKVAEDNVAVAEPLRAVVRLQVACLHPGLAGPWAPMLRKTAEEQRLRRVRAIRNKMWRRSGN